MLKLLLCSLFCESLCQNTQHGRSLKSFTSPQAPSEVLLFHKTAHRFSEKLPGVKNLTFFFNTGAFVCFPHFLSNPFYHRPLTLSLSFPASPADPLCRPANGGCAREDEGEESADRRAGHARNTSQRKSLTPWAEAGKTVILFFFSLPSSLPPRLLLSGSWAEPS